MASAFEVAEKLMKENYSVVRFTEGSRLENGVVEVADNVNVQVSHLDRSFNVVHHDPENGSFQFFPSRYDFKSLLSDLSTVMNG